jgi:excisionase family DNA binding protein
LNQITVALGDADPVKAPRNHEALKGDSTQLQRQMRMDLFSPDSIFALWLNLAPWTGRTIETVGDKLNQKLAYTVEEAAELLSLSRAHVYRLIELQELGSIKVGRNRRVTARQLQELIQKLEARSGVHPLDELGLRRRA